MGHWDYVHMRMGFLPWFERSREPAIYVEERSPIECSYASVNRAPCATELTRHQQFQTCAVVGGDFVENLLKGPLSSPMRFPQMTCTSCCVRRPRNALILRLQQRIGMNFRKLSMDSMNHLKPESPLDTGTIIQTQDGVCRYFG